MNLKEYTTKALLTESVIPTVIVDVEKLTAILETMIAAGNLLDVIKKDTFYGLPTDPAKLNSRLERLRTNALQLRTSADVAAPLTVLTNSPQPLATLNPRVVHGIIGLATESIELLEALLKAINNQTDIDGINVLEELGDINWYHAIVVDALQGDWEQIQQTNLDKLAARNKGAKFNAEATINRDVASERAILEQGLM